MSAEQVKLLKQFVQLCQANPDVLHQPAFAFYREYLQSLGAKIPPTAPGTGGASDTEKSPTEESKSETNAKPVPMYEEQPDEELEPELPAPELDNTGVIEDKSGDEELPMGDPSKEVSEEYMEKAGELRDQAAAAFSEGDYQKALEYYTKAIETNPGSAILHAKRANTLLKMSKLRAAIKDCSKAIELNPDSAAPYKFRGRAHRLLGNWLEAHKDLALSCKLDYDDTANEWLKEVESNAKKLLEYQRAKERHAEEKDLRERRERVRRAQEANKRAAEEAKKHHGEDEEEGFDFGPGGGGAGGGFGMGAFSELFKELSDDPELLAAMKNDPSLIQKLMEIMQNPSNMMKYMGDPNVQKLLVKLGSKFGGAGGMPFPGSAPFGGGPDAANQGFEQQEEDKGPSATFGNAPPKKAPEPDLD